MTKALRAVGALAAASLAVPLWAVPAQAETVAETAVTGAYYLSTNPGVFGDVEGNPVGGQKAPDNAKSADGVAQDDLAVAVVTAGTGMPDKFSALQFAVLDLLPGSTVSKATLVVPISTNPDSQSPVKDPSLIVACAVGNEGFGDSDGEPIGDAPTVACDQVSAEAKAIEGGNAFEFDVTALAQTWVDANNGVALYPSEAGFGRPFQTVFAPKGQARLTVAFTSAETEEPPLDDGGLGDTAFDAGGSTGLDSGSYDSGSVDSGGLDTGTSSLGSLDAPAVAADMPAVGSTAPVVAQPIVRTARFSSPMAFDGLTWVALVAGAAVLALASLALGAPTPVPAAARTSVRPGGVASALARRRATSLNELRPI